MKLARRVAAVNSALGTIFNSGYIREIGLRRWLWRYPLWQSRKRLGRGPISLRLPHGLEIALPRGSHFSSALFLPRGFVDWGSELALVRMMPRDRALLDIGAHFGYYSLVAAAAGVRCVAFEPDPRNAPMFLEATVGVANIELRRLAVSDAPGRATFIQNTSSACSHLADSRPDDGTGVAVDVTTVDEVAFGGNLPVGGIKIDVEGFDRHVLRGARRTLREHRPVVCTESVRDGELEAFAAGLDYRVGAFVRIPGADSKRFIFGPWQDVQVCPMLFLVPRERSDEMLAVTSAISREHGG